MDMHTFPKTLHMIAALEIKFILLDRFHSFVELFIVKPVYKHTHAVDVNKVDM